MNNNRYFIAVPLPDEVKHPLSMWCERMKREYSFRKWVHEQDYHITLKFLGACSADQLRQVKESLAQITQGLPLFHMSIGRPGYFGDVKSPRVLWAGVEGDLMELEQLQSRIENRTSELGFETENRPYRPHITLARNSRGESFQMDRLSASWDTDMDACSWHVKSVVLYQTDLGSEPMYVNEAAFIF